MPVREEVELKYRLEDREQYERLCRALGEPDDEWEQRNHYFHSADGKVPGDDGVIRIRLEKGRGVFTVKLGGILHEGVAIVREYEEPWPESSQPVPPDSDALWSCGHPGMRTLEEVLGGRVPLVWAGEMVNLRKVYRLPRGLVLEVDASRYPDGTEDFEVEVETDRPEEIRERLVQLLEGLGVRHAPQNATKYQRFLRHLAFGPSKPVG